MAKGGARKRGDSNGITSKKHASAAPNAEDSPPGLPAAAASHGLQPFRGVDGSTHWRRLSKCMLCYQEVASQKGPHARLAASYWQLATILVSAARELEATGESSGPHAPIARRAVRAARQLENSRVELVYWFVDKHKHVSKQKNFDKMIPGLARDLARHVQDATTSDSPRRLGVLREEPKHSKPLEDALRAYLEGGRHGYAKRLQILLDAVDLKADARLKEHDIRKRVSRMRQREKV